MVIRNQSRMAFVDTEKGIGFECYQGGIYCLGINDSDGRPALKMGFYESELAASLAFEQLYKNYLKSENYDFPDQKRIMDMFGLPESQKEIKIEKQKNDKKSWRDDPDLNEFNKKIQTELGVSLSGSGSSSTYKIGSHKQVLKMIKESGIDKTFLVIEIPFKAWMTDSHHFDVRILLDVYAFMLKNNWEINDDEVAKRISRISGKNGRPLAASDFAFRVDRENLGAVTEDLYYRYRKKK